MYNILVVDDEMIERKGIISLLQKCEYPVQPFEAKNGKEALAKLAGQPMDVMITDIRMPIMDGIQLMSQASQLYPALEIIVNSTYADFAYAQQAMQYGAVDYLLKFVNVPDFRRIMDKVLEKCAEKRRRQEEENRVRQMAAELEQYHAARALEELLRVGQELSLPDNARQWYSLHLQSRPVLPMTALCHKHFFNLYYDIFYQALARAGMYALYSVNLSETESVLLFDAEPMPQKVALEQKGAHLIEALRLQTGCELFLVYGNAVCQPEQLAAEYRELDKVREYTFFLKRGEVIFHEKGYLNLMGLSMVDSGIVEVIYEDIQYADYQKLVQDFRLLNTTLEKKVAYSKLYVQNLFTAIFQKLYAKVPELPYGNLNECVSKIFQFTNQHALSSYVCEELDRVAGHAGRLQSYAGEEKVMRQVEAIVRQEYANDELGVAYLAQKVALSPNYLGNLFKKASGESLAKYIRNVRLEKARQLLLGADTKISDIARITGFSNDSYFVAVFRTRFGVTPARYRENNGQTENAP